MTIEKDRPAPGMSEFRAWERLSLRIMFWFWCATGWLGLLERLVHG